MPLDSNFGMIKTLSEEEWIKKFSWLPRRCEITKKIIWLKYAYCGTTTKYDFSNMSGFEDKRWHNSNAHLIWVIKNVK